MTREEVFQRIANRLKKNASSCDCIQCKRMCHTPCLGTPHDILALINAGYIDKLQLTLWAAGITLGFTSKIIPMVQARVEDGWCVFYHDGMCELHDSGLKPTEGVLASHEVSFRELTPKYNLTYNVAREWNDEHLDIINEIAKKLNEHLEEEE